MEEDRLEDYEMLERLGRGSFGEVFKAVNKKTEMTYAIKIVDLQDELIYNQISRELQVLTDCKNERIIFMHESFVKNNDLYMVLEYLAGGSVRDILNVRGALQEVYICILMRELLLALDYLHSNNLIHRDIKAANILLSSNGDVKLGDFGVTAQITETLQKRQSFVGTPY